MSNIAGALYTVNKIKNEMKCSRRMRSVSRQCQFKQPCLQAAPEGKLAGGCSRRVQLPREMRGRRASGRPDHQSRRVSRPELTVGTNSRSQL